MDPASHIHGLDLLLHVVLYCLVQGLGVSTSTAQRILAKSKAKGPTFIAQGPVKQLTSV